MKNALDMPDYADSDLFALTFRIFIASAFRLFSCFERL